MGGLIPAHAGKTLGTNWEGRQFGAHPRSRGENKRTALHLDSYPGSSPLTRGKRKRELLLSPALRLIPAHAGKTSMGGRTTFQPRAHPRSRGENSATHSPILVPSGSSPLTRGKLPVRLGGGVQGGLIPAHAGKTYRCADHGCGCGAHPRSRGENVDYVSIGSAFRGSSPLTRGKLRHLGNHQRPGGLIPAHAGKTPRRTGR